MTNFELITSITALLSVVAVLLTAFVAWTVYQGQQKLSQRQLIIPLWNYLSNIRAIDPEDPITEDVIHLVNTLELVAICCEGGMVDEDVIRRTFKDGFLEHAESILSIQKKIPLIDKNGQAVLKENRAAYQFYQKISEEDLSNNRLRK
ncbi:DUF4760 domain-containing protein [Vibrio splendidus]